MFTWLNIDAIVGIFSARLWILYVANLAVVIGTKLHPIPTVALLVLIVLHILTYLNNRLNLPRTKWNPIGKNDVALITGGSRGLGKELAIQLLKRHAKVIVYDVVAPDYDHPKLIWVECDLGNERSLKSTLKKTIKSLNQYGQSITILVNNAGIRHSESLLDLEDDQIHSLFNINTLSQIWTVKQVVQNHLRVFESTKAINKQKLPRLQIVSVSSILGTLAPKNLSVYSATKAANLSIYEALTLELSKYNSIRILQVAPGQLTTDMFKDVSPSRQFFAPLVNHRRLAHSIAAKIDVGHAGVLCEPLYANFLPVVRVLPISLQKLCRWFSQMDTKIGQPIDRKDND